MVNTCHSLELNLCTLTEEHGIPDFYGILKGIES